MIVGDVKGRAKGVWGFLYFGVKGRAKMLEKYKAALLPAWVRGAKGRGKRVVLFYKHSHFASYSFLQSYKPFFLSICIYISIYSIIKREKRGRETEIL
jgi:hypothetical protein